MVNTEDAVVGAIVGSSIVVGTAVAAKFRYDVGRVEIDPAKRAAQKHDIELEENGGNGADQRLVDIYETIREGAQSFLFTEYVYLAVFMVIFGTILFLVKGLCTKQWGDAAFTVLCFLVGASTSIMAGYLGMQVATFSNARVTIGAENNLSDAFTTAFKGGGVMGFSLVTMGITTLFLMYLLLGATQFKGYLDTQDIRRRMMETLAAYGVGASCVALFARVGGGIYTKAADVGADLVGKIEQGIPEDDPRNPAVIADNVGDNVGDIAGMGADLFGSFAGSTCAAFVLLSEVEVVNGTAGETLSWGARLFPLLMSSVGIIAGALSCHLVMLVSPVTDNHRITSTLKWNEVVSTVVSAAGLVATAYGVLPVTMVFRSMEVHQWKIMVCGLMGLFGGLAIGVLTEYYTSNEYQPVKDVAQSCRTGAATNIIYGLALGYHSTVIPAFIIALIIFVNNILAGTLGVAIGTLGVLTTLTTSLTIDAFGPICDNAGGIAEMAGLPHEVRERTDALDAAGNTTAAIGKGFAIGSAALVAFALLGAFTRRVAGLTDGVSAPGLNDGYAEYAIDAAGKRIWREGNGIGTEMRLLDPAGFAGLLVGSMLPYWFSAMTMKSVGTAALAMVEEVRRQFKENPGIMEGTVKPDYHACIRIATQASLTEGGPPGLLVILSPIIAGFLFGTRFLTGMLAGALVSGVQMAISASNSGGAWDNAKKYIGAGYGDLGGKGSEAHNAAIIGDTVGDPLKDTSGPALNILIKLMGIISVVFASSMIKAEQTYSTTKPYGLLGRIFKFD